MGESDVDKSLLYSRYRDLLENVVDEDLDLKDKEETVVEEALVEADNLFSKVDNTRLCILDAQLIERVSEFCVQNARSVNTNLQSFEAMEFAEKIASYVTVGSLSKDSRCYSIPVSKWVSLGKGTQCLFPRSPFLSYLNGSMSKERTTQVVTQKKQRAQKPSQNIASMSTKSTLLTESDQELGKGNNQTEVLVESTFRQLVREFRAADRRPVNYFTFVLDPNSFAKTVENIFHLSFLIHEKKVALIFDEEESPFPFVHPVKQKKAAKDSTDYTDEEKPPKFQSVISIQKQEWVDLVEYFGLKSPLIDHDAFLSKDPKEDEGRKRIKR